MDKNQFKISLGNKQVLETIPSMMQDRLFRRYLRELVLNFIMKKEVMKPKRRKK